MRANEVFMHLGLLDALPKSGLQRRRIMAYIYGLREEQNPVGDFTEKDASQRVRQVKIVGGYAITFWLDAPVSAVMVVDIRPADK
jgi:hypothetical protein